MVEINLWSALARVTDGAQVVEIDATTVGEALDALVARHPGLAPYIEAGVSVAVDGEVITGNRLAEIPEGAEVFLMQRVKGG